MTEDDDKIKDGLCYCQCEGAYDHACGICPVHPPQSLEEMREIVKKFREEYYKLGRMDAIFEMRKALEEIK